MHNPKKPKYALKTIFKMYSIKTISYSLFQFVFIDFKIIRNILMMKYKRKKHLVLLTFEIF